MPDLDDDVGYDDAWEAAGVCLRVKPAFRSWPGVPVGMAIPPLNGKVQLQARREWRSHAGYSVCATSAGFLNCHSNWHRI
jgi:hypothetical protein